MVNNITIIADQNVYISVYAIGFDVTVVDTENMGGNDFRQTMMNFSSDEKHGDIMVLVVMSHGYEGGHSGQILTSKNGERIDIEHDIFRSEIFVQCLKYLFSNIRMFSNHCPQLIDIPKFFIIQASKGNQLGVGVRRSGENISLKEH